VLVLSFPSQKDVDGLKERSAPGTGIGDYLKQAMFDVLGIKPALLAKVDTRPPERDTSRTPPTGPHGTSEHSAPGQDEPSDFAEGERDEVEREIEPAPEAAQGWYTAPVPGSTPTEDHPAAEASAIEPPAATAKPTKAAAAPVAENATSAPPRQRYGESVVREILGASFIEEQTIEARVVPESL
jgi:DNA polymerase III subunit gamma/tau